jgi:hypothetical protein
MIYKYMLTIHIYTHTCIHIYIYERVIFKGYTANEIIFVLGLAGK